MLLAIMPTQVWHIYCANNCSEVIDMMSKKSFALVIFDTETPGIDGLEFNNLISECCDTKEILGGGCIEEELSK